jgi:hypothetical protein
LHSTRLYALGTVTACTRLYTCTLKTRDATPRRCQRFSPLPALQSAASASVRCQRFSPLPALQSAASASVRCQRDSPLLPQPLPTPLASQRSSYIDHRPSTIDHRPCPVRSDGSTDTSTTDHRPVLIHPPEHAMARLPLLLSSSPPLSSSLLLSSSPPLLLSSSPPLLACYGLASLRPSARGRYYTCRLRPATGLWLGYGRATCPGRRIGCPEQRAALHLGAASSTPFRSSEQHSI